MTEVTMYSTRSCGYCQSAEHLLRRMGVDRLNKVLVDTEPDKLDQMFERTGRRTVPQIFIGTVHVGGFDDLQILQKSGRLGELLGR